MKGIDEVRRAMDARKEAKEARKESLKEALKGRRIDQLKKNKQEIEALRQATGLSVEKIREYLDQPEKQGKIKI